ncbi:MAG: hypothetical protein ACC642_11775, partial [Pseudomonadales bacterium]
TPLVPKGNFLPGLKAYARLFERTGFVEVEVRDVYRETWLAFRQRYTRFMLADGRGFTPRGMRAAMAANIGCAWAVRQSLIAGGVKPDE